jgi:DNA-binding NarL/FixJ family response regulator
VLLVDAHPVVRAGLRAVLADARDLEAAGDAGDAREAARRAAELRPDVVVLGAHEDASAIREVRRAAPDARVLVLAAVDDLPSVLGAVRAGARGYVLKDAGEEEVVRAVRAVGRGHATFGADVADRLLEHLATAEPPAGGLFARLGARERDVLELLAQGAATGQIARRLHLSPKTVRNHVSAICTKLEVVDRTQAALLAREAGWGLRGR